VRERSEPFFTAGRFRRQRPGPSRSTGLQVAALHQRIQETVKYRRGQLRLRWTRIRQADGP